MSQSLFPKERFLTRVTQGATPDDCWGWDNGSIDKGGYAHFFLDGKLMGAHTASHILFIGPIINDPSLPRRLRKIVLHACNNRACTNPRHLTIGTYKRNAEQREEENRCAHAMGTHVASSKLTEQDVLYIRANPQMSCAELARALGVKSSSTIKYVKDGRTWKHLLQRVA